MKKNNISFAVTFAAALLFGAGTLILSACNNQPQPTPTEDSTPVAQKIADLEAALAVAQQEYADALQQATSAQVEANQKAAIAKKKGTQQAKDEAADAQKRADQLKADADAKGEKMRQIETEISQLKNEPSDEEETTTTQPVKKEKAASKEKAAPSDNTAATNKDEPEAPKAAPANRKNMDNDFQTILEKWRNCKNSKQKANQFCTGVLGIRISGGDPFQSLEQHYKSLDNEQKDNMLNKMEKFRFTGDKD